MVLHIFTACASIYHEKFCNFFFNRVVSHFKEKVGSTGVLSREHMVHVVVVGLDKATIWMHYYLAPSRSQASEQMFLKVVCCLNGQWNAFNNEKVNSQTCWLNYTELRFYVG